MPLKTRVSKWGSSLAVRIPKAIAEEWGIKEGTSIEMFYDNDRLRLRKRKYTLEEMVASLKDAKLHPEIETDGPRGNEVW